ncbi:MAG: ComEC/Rec2 family competence protein, partial [Dehalococcoidia bacterium]
MTLFAVAIAWLACVSVWALDVRPLVAAPFAFAFALLLPARGVRRRALHLLAAIAAVAIASQRLGPTTASIPANSIGRSTGQDGHLLVTADADGDPHPTYVSAYAHAKSRAVARMWSAASGGVSLLLPATADIRSGDLLDVSGQVDPPGGGVNDGYGAWLRRRGVVASLAFPRLALVNRPGESGAVAVWRSVRNGVEQGLTNALPPSEAGLASALLFGNHHALPPELSADLNATGATHLAVVSAYNLMLVFGAATASLASLIGRRRSLLLGMALSLGYGLAAGQSAAVGRGEILVVLLALTSLTGRPHSRPALLLLAAAAMTVVSPSLLSDPGFQLTFAAAGGIAVLAPGLRGLIAAFDNDGDSWMPLVLRVPLEGALVGLAVSLAIVPVSTATFGSVSLVAPFANALVNPFIPFTALLSLLTGLASWAVPFLGILPAAPLWLLLRGIELALHAAAAVPGASVQVRIPGLPFAVAWYLGLLTLIPTLPHFARRLRQSRHAVGRRRLSTEARVTPHRALPGAVLACFAALLVLGPRTALALQAGSARTSVRWLDGTKGSAALVVGRNGTRALVTASESPGALAQALQRTTGESSVDIIVAPIGRGDDAGWLQVAAALHAQQVLLPAEQASASSGAAALPHRRISRVSGAASIALGGGDRLDLFTFG